jgi:orotidine-5'-phosphate decarboxylase
MSSKIASNKSKKQTALEMVQQKWSEGKFVCVGLDSDLSQIPQFLKDREIQAHEVMFAFNRQIISKTSDLVCAYKINSAFYEAQGDGGILALERTVWHLKKEFPQIPVVLDAKRADIGNTNHGYVSSAFDHLGVDAITVHPYLGKEALKPFLEREDKLIFVLVRTSNPGAGELQDLKVGDEKVPLYQVVAKNIASDWNEHGNCGVVVGATYPEELSRVREIVQDMPILIPGIGSQGGDLEATVRAGLDSQKKGIIINSSRGIIFASKEDDFAEAARREVQSLQSFVSSIIK